MKQFAKIMALVLAAAMLMTFMAACGGSTTDSGSGSNDAASSDILKGTWKQTDAVNGDWTWTFDGAGGCKLVGDTTGIETDGTYKLDENAKTLSVSMKLWDDDKVYDYTLSGDTLDLSSTYSSYHLIKQ